MRMPKELNCIYFIDALKHEIRVSRKISSSYRLIMDLHGNYSIHFVSQPFLSDGKGYNLEPFSHGIANYKFAYEEWT